ncbi:hypothetical protein PSACC_02638 [Paramicrosporidium saccamoebae]|uniref:Uncharacterized protein n=1 Tax=Paramicrosporidium saccamoebae TaxID=1246581 RepID=A0A2H9TIG2_9FUNG|nr:hypothetical protein PSACC_02638 [Paramicrosporidium saccamoebae]
MLETKLASLFAHLKVADYSQECLTAIHDAKATLTECISRGDLQPGDCRSEGMAHTPFFIEAIQLWNHMVHLGNGNSQKSMITQKIAAYGMLDAMHMCALASKAFLELPEPGYCTLYLQELFMNLGHSEDVKLTLEKINGELDKGAIKQVLNSVITNDAGAVLSALVTCGTVFTQDMAVDLVESALEYMLQKSLLKTPDDCRALFEAFPSISDRPCGRVINTARQVDSTSGTLPSDLTVKELIQVITLLKATTE